jgi:hypothetical protein
LIKGTRIVLDSFCHSMLLMQWIAMIFVVVGPFGPRLIPQEALVKVPYPGVILLLNLYIKSHTLRSSHEAV